MEELRINDKSPMVEYLQSILQRLGLYKQNIDGIFGEETKEAVKEFQRMHNIPVSGVVDHITWEQLAPYIEGRHTYTIRENDTLFHIANDFQTTVNRIKIANPDIDKNNLRIGEVIKIPTGNIVPTNISYSSNILELNIRSLKDIYPFIGLGTIGKSVLGKDIHCMRIGNGEKAVFYHAAIHANEWITAVVFMKFIEEYCKAYVDGTEIYGYKAEELYRECTLYIVPMANPDGVDLVTGQMRKDAPDFDKVKQIANDYPNIPFPSGWKANINGVDLNLQFPAEWEKAKEIKFAQGYTSPAPRDFVGETPVSQPEAIALYNFTNYFDFSLILSYHSQGKEIYWKFQDYLPKNSEQIGEALAASSGYTLASTPYNSSFAGYKDWFIQDFNKPGYTVEVGIGENPLPISQFPEIYSDNIGILVLSMVLS